MIEYDPQYPDQDGRVSESTEQYRWIVMLHTNLESLFAENPHVFVAADNLIYAVEGEPKKRTAPDVYVAFGRPKGPRGSYKVWRENGIFPQVIFEVISPGNRPGEMLRKFKFYEHFGVEEYYIIDPQLATFEAFFRTSRNRLKPVKHRGGVVSPRMKVTFDTSSWPLPILKPNGERFLFADEIEAERQRQLRRVAQTEASLDQEKARADEMTAIATQRQIASDRLRQKLRELGVDPDTL